MPVPTDRVRDEILALTRKGRTADVERVLRDLTNHDLVALSQALGALLTAAGQVDRRQLERHIAALAAALPADQDPYIAALIKERSHARDDEHRAAVDHELAQRGYQAGAGKAR